MISIQKVKGNNKKAMTKYSKNKLIKKVFSRKKKLWKSKDMDCFSEI
jgi:hypothetical protein